MRRVVVPLDGTEQAALAIPDAQHLTGQGGELILVRDVRLLLGDERLTGPDDRVAIGELDQYLHAVATTLQHQGMTVRVWDQAEILSHLPDESEPEWEFDLIAHATRDSDSGRKLAWHSTLHQALTNSPVPILVCRPDSPSVRSEPTRPRLMVPLDGSDFAETALPLAEELAKEWNVPLRLTQVVPVQAAPYAEEVTSSTDYLQRIASCLDCPVRIDVVTGQSTSTMLVRTVKDWSITDVVMASHGRTASPRAVVGSVAAALIQHLRCRIVVIPPLVAESMAPLARFAHDEPSVGSNAIRP